MAINLSTIWKRVTPPWRYALGVFVCARVALTVWSYVVYLIFPVALQNLDLFGEPVLTAFYLKTSERNAYSRMIDGTTLSFRALDEQTMTDNQTGSLWSIQSGQAIQGKLSGAVLNPSEYDVDRIFPYLGVEPSDHLLLSLWQRFDANWYLMIAERGYQPNGSTVYFPMYPFLLRLFSFLMEPMFAALLISNLALIGALGLLYQFALPILPEADVRRSILYLMLFPAAFFLTSPYTESLFLFFILASLLTARRGQWGWSVFWGMLASLTRLQGILLVVPLAYLAWQDASLSTVRAKLIRFALLGLLPLATLSFLAVTNLSLLSTYEGTLNARFVFPWTNILAAVSLLLSGNGSIIDAINLVVTLGLVILMIPIGRKLPLEYLLYSLPMLVAPLLRMTTTQPLVSMVRYALAIFPVFMVMGQWGGNRWINRVVVYSSLALQLYLSAQFILWGWVG